MLDTSLTATAELAMNQAKAGRPTPLVKPGDSPESLRQAAEDFEAMFIAQMLTPMFEGLDADPIFGGGAGEEMVRGLMIQEYGKAIVQGGGLGVADHVQSALLALQEQTQANQG